MWTNGTQQYIKSGILYTSVSDHFPAYSIFSMPDHNKTSIHKTKGIYSNDNINAFRDALIKIHLYVANVPDLMRPHIA